MTTSFYFLRQTGPANAVRRPLRFRLAEPVRIKGERHAPAVVIGTRTPKPWSEPEYLVQRDGDGSMAWLAEDALVEKLTLAVIDGGKP